MKENLTKKILMGLLFTGAVMIAATSPYFIVNIARHYIKRKEYKSYNKRKIAQAFSNLKKNRLVILKEKGDKIIVELTEKGKRRLKEYQFDDLQITNPKTWDHKWRIIIFDIPDKKRVARNVLRDKLKKLGFFQLQKSVWVHPFPCENEIQLVAEIFQVTPFVNIILAEKIFNDVNLKKHFHLL
ncbi:MAG: CRISPR-associated endonuclease Cas2 [bacterium]